MKQTHPYTLENIRVIHNPRLKNSYISLTQDAILTIKTPYNTQSYLQKILDEKSSWIEKQLKKIALQKPLEMQPLHTLEFIQDKLIYFAQEMGLEFKEVKFKKMKSRWGSCRSDGLITLNTHLRCVQESLLEYVLVHELSHLVHMNHSKAFHSLVELYLPEQYSLRKELKKIRLGD